MEPVIKNGHAMAHTLIDGFLQRNKDRHGGIYTDDLYKYLGADFVPGRTKTRKALVDILLKEQHGRCCYCMRRIDGLPPEEVSIEHVIVNHPKDDNDYNQYLGKSEQLDAADMIPSSEFIARQTPPPPYPHSVAYENMLMSCAGHCHLGVGTSFTCNNYRAHKFVHPLPLTTNINKEIKYRTDGSVYWVNETDTVNPTVDNLGLNYVVLQLIRRIWYKVASKGLNVHICNRQELIYEVLGEMIDEGKDDAAMQTLFLFANNTWYWDLLLQFDYFDDKAKFEPNIR